MESMDNREFKIDEKFHKIERQIGEILNKEENANQQKKTGQDNYKDLKELVNQLKTNYDS